MKIIKPPKKTTSTYYHNKAMGYYAKIKILDKEIKKLTTTKKYIVNDYKSNISARNNSIKWEKTNKQED